MSVEQLEQIDNFGFCFVLSADPFADANKGSEDDVQDGLVHIRIQQRNGRKTLTTVQGLSSDYDLKKIVRACKKVRNTHIPSRFIHADSYDESACYGYGLAGG